MVGGGILALAGVAFSVSGPSAILAFVLNGIIAFITALSFAEMATANPQSGGTYNFAKKALSVQVAFGVGWIVWFASIVAAVLYALGFGAFLWFAVQQILPPDLIEQFGSRTIILFFALTALGGYTWSLTRSNGGGGTWVNIGKVIVFGVLIAGGLAAFFRTSLDHVTTTLEPFFAGGGTGLLMAMGYTFIAMQGFDLIAAVGGEVKNPAKTIPKAMIATLIIGLTIYLPLLFVVMTVGMEPGQKIAELSSQYPETVVAIAAENYLGSFGLWFVTIAGIISMLTALQANIFAASRVALAMANDRTLAWQLSHIDRKTGTPIPAILVTAAIIGTLIIVLPNVAAAGAASSLIFLITFALGHVICYLMRKRTFSSTETFQTPFFPLIPIVGFLACFGLAIFQAFAEPAAGGITLVWLGMGVALFMALFAGKARVYDAAAEARDPDMVRLRGLKPLVLVPVANPDNAKSMVFVANALAPPVVGRVLLLSIVIPPKEQSLIPEKVTNSQRTLQLALETSLEVDVRPDALTTIATEPWDEISRVVETHQCRSLLLGLSNLQNTDTVDHLENLVKSAACDVIVFRQPFAGWQILNSKKILVPVAGMSEHDALRARLIGSLWREIEPEVTFLQILPENTPDKKIDGIKKKLKGFARNVVPGKSSSIVIKSNDVTQTLVNEATNHDLTIMGLGSKKNKQVIFGNVILDFARKSDCALIIISKF